MDAQLLTEGTKQQIPRVWIKAFYGFNPEETSYLGFTKLGDRDSFIAEARQGDLVLIYGSTSPETPEDKRRQVLGFLEVDLIPVKDIDRSSPAAKRNKIERGWQDRWTHGVIVRKAWKITRRIEVKNIAPVTYVSDRARRIASRGALLTPEEAVLALQLPALPTNVFNETPVSNNDMTGDGQPLFVPSRGLKPAFGERTSNYVDGECSLYMMVANGNIGTLLGRSQDDVKNMVLVKIGYSNDPSRRCSELNSGIPPAAIFKWCLGPVSKPYFCASDAKAAEDQLKMVLSQSTQSLGGEFFLGTQININNAFYGIPGVALVIKGAYRPPKYK